MNSLLSNVEFLKNNFHYLFQRFNCSYFRFDSSKFESQEAGEAINTKNTLAQPKIIKIVCSELSQKLINKF